MLNTEKIEKLVNAMNGLSQYAQKKDQKQVILSSEQINRLIQMFEYAEVGENPYTPQYLEQAYAAIPDEERNLFSIDQLFEEGFILYDLDEWRFNIRFRTEYERLQEPEQEKEKQILNFLKLLAKNPYEDQLQVRIMQSSEGIEEFVNEADGNIQVDFNGKGWEKYGNAVMGIWWDTICESPEPERLSKYDKWLLIWTRMNRGGYRPEENMEHVHELYEFCLDRLEKEVENSAGRRIWQIYERNIWLHATNEERKNIAKKVKKFPDLLQRVEDARCRWSQWCGTITKNVSRVMHFCMRNISYANNDQRERLYKLLVIPYPYEDLQYLENCTELLVEGMEQKELFSLCAVTILKKALALQTMYSEQINGILKELCQYVFTILEKNTQCGDCTWVDAIMSFEWYLNRESNYGMVDNQRGNNRKKYEEIHEAYGKWYAENICCNNVRMRKMLVDRYESKFKNTSGADATHAFQECIWLLGKEHTQEAVVKALRLYGYYLKRVPEDDMLISQTDWKFWEGDIWKDVMRLVARTDAYREEFLDAITISTIKECIRDTDHLSILHEGKAGMIHIYMMTVLFLEMSDEMSASVCEEMEQKFEEFFDAIWDNSEVMQPYGVQLLNTGNVIQRVIWCVEKMPEAIRVHVCRKLQNADVSVILMFLEYIRHNGMREKFVNNLVERIEEDFSKNIVTIPTLENTVQQLLNVAEMEENTALVEKTAKMVDELEQELAHKPQPIQKTGKMCVDSLRARIGIALHDEDMLKRMENGEAGAFYQGYVKLKSDKLEDIKEAERIYRECIKVQKNGSYYINALASCVKILANDEVLESDRKKYRAHADQYLKEMEQMEMLMTGSQKRIMWENKLFLYMEEKDFGTFWFAVNNMPQELWSEISCVQYIAEMYYKEGQVDKAFALLKKMDDHGVNAEEIKCTISNMKMLNDNDAFPTDLLSSVEQSESREKMLLQLRQALIAIESLNIYESAYVHLQRNDLVMLEEAHMMIAFLSTIHVLGEHAGLMIRENKTAEENTYSKFIQILFNRSMTEIFGFCMEDQTQGGATGTVKKNGEDGIGSIDLCICKKCEKQAIVEVVKMAHYDESKLKQHLLKLVAYNYANVPLMIHLILSDGENPESLWDNYTKNLNGYWEDRADWKLQKIIQKNEIEFIQKKMLNFSPEFLLLTELENEKMRQKVRVYHVLVDIAHKDKKKLAKYARSKPERKVCGENKK